MATEINLFVDHETLTLNEDGQWLSNGIEVTHKAQIKAFHQHIRRRTDGYFIEIKNETKKIEVKDTPFFVEALHTSTNARDLWLLSDGTQEPLDPHQLECQYSHDRGLKIRVKKSHPHWQPNGAWARLKRSVYHQFLSALEEDSECYFLKFGGNKIRVHRK